MNQLNYLKKLRDIEIDYRKFYQDSSLDIFEHPLEVEEYRQIIQSSNPKYKHLFLADFSEILSEDMFFYNSQDVAIFQHYRYMPATFHQHDFFELACVLSGSCMNYIKKQRIKLNAGDILILSPHTKHAICTYQDDCVIVNILIRSSTFEQHFLNLLPNNDLLYNFFVKTLYHSSDMPYLIFKTGENSLLTNYVLQIHQEYTRNKRYKKTMLSSLISLFFVVLLRNYEKDVIIPGVNPSVMNENTIFILQYMQKHYSTITLSHLAEFFNYSERQMQRIITSATGLSFSENIRKLRMTHAAEMLESSNMTVQEIADFLGYYDASNFRQLFKKYYQKTPQQYRDEKKQKNEII